MELFALIAAVLVVLGAPALAAVAWRRSLDDHLGASDSVEILAVAYGGIAIAALSIWLVAELAGPGWRAVLFAALAAALLLLTPAVARALGRRGDTAGDEALTGQYDGRVVPELAHQDRPALRLEAPASNAHFAVLAIAGGLFALLVWLPFLTFGWQRADGIHRMAMTDWYKHLVTTTALASADVFPPANPFLHAADAAPYYYGFHLVAASIARLGGALTGGASGDLVYAGLLLLTLLTAVATPFVVYTCARTIAAGRGDSLGDAASVPMLAALGATFLAGFDLVPMAIDAAFNVAAGAARGGGLAALRAMVPSTHLDYWIHHNERQFNAPYLTTAWAPQHMAAVLVALLIVHLFIRRHLAARRAGVSSPLGAGWLLPALLLAGLPALSAFVALGLAAAVAGAALVESVRGRCMVWHTRVWQQWLLPGLAAALLALPVIATLAGGATGGLTLQVSSAGRWVNGAVWTALFGESWLTGAVDSVAVYVVELGVLGILAAFEARRLARKGRLLPHQQQVVWMVVSLLVLLVFVRPPVGGPNNLYARPLVLAWCLMAPFAAMRFARLAGLVARTGGSASGERPETSRAHRRQASGNSRSAIAAVALCLAATAFAAVGVVLEGALFWATPPATVEATRWINENAAPDAVVAVAPDDFTGSLGYWLRRPLALADERHALLFGADAEGWERVADALRATRGGASASAAQDALRAAGADLFLLSRASGEPDWLSSACFATPFRNDRWIVAAPLAGLDCDDAR